MKRLFLLCLLATFTPAFAGENDGPTALQLIKEGNEYVGKEARDRVVEIRSDKSIGTVTPNIWYVVYYDPDATAKAVEVKFAAGKKLTVKRPARLLEFVTGNTELPRRRLKIDSDKALAAVLKEPELANIHVRASQMWLQQNHDYGFFWKVKLWAEKIRRPTESAEIGEILISADEGKVLKTDLHLKRVD